MSDQTFKSTEQVVGSGHPTLSDTINRLALVEHNTDGTHKSSSLQSMIGGTSTISRVTGSDFVTASNSLVNITGLSNALVANSVYRFDAFISCSSGTLNGDKLGIQFSAAGAVVEGEIVGGKVGGALEISRITAFNTPSPALISANADGLYHMRGIIVVGANPGNLTAQILKITSGNATVYINSYLETNRIA